MYLDRYVRLTAGFFVLLSLALGYWVSPKWHLFTAFVGVNLVQSAFTNWCPLITFFGRHRRSSPPSCGSTSAR
jgi:hypothetical protein